VADTSAQRVQFYLLPGADERSRFRLACRLIEEAYLAGERVYVWLDGPLELAQFDDMLWTFADRSFVPHERYLDAQQWQATPVLLSCESAPSIAFDLLLNLGAQVPAAASMARRITEIIDADEPRRRAGRMRFRQYRDQGLTPETHNISVDRAS
jgi:DNA polymerase-3 subunit chi